MLLTLVDRVSRLGLRCVRVVAGAGWGKSTFARTYVNAHANAAIVDARGLLTMADFERVLQAGLDAVGAPPHDDVLQRWQADAPPSAIVIDSGTSVMQIDGSVDRIRHLLRTLPAHRTVMLCSRIEYPIVWSTYFAPHETTVIGADELAIDETEVQLMLSGFSCDPEVEERALRISRGWPIAMLLFARLASEGRLTAALERLDNVATFGDLHAYVQAEIFERLDPHELETLCAVAVLGEARRDDIALVLGRDVEPDLRRLSGRFRYLLDVRDDTFRVIPIARATAETLLRGPLRVMAQMAIDRLSAHGRRVRAAEIAMRFGDAEAACAALDDECEPLPGTIPGAGYIRVALQLDVRQLLRARNILTVLIAGFVPIVVQHELYRKLAAAQESMRFDIGDAAERTMLHIALAALSRFTGRYDEATRYADLALQEVDVLASDAPAVRLLHVVRASLAALFLDPPSAERAWRSSGEPADITATYFAVDRAELEVLVALASADARVHREAYARVMGVVAEWTHPDARRVARAFYAACHFYAEGRFPPDQEAAAIGTSADDASFSRALRFTSMGLVSAAVQQTDRELAHEMLMRAIGAADRLGLPFPRVLARVVATKACEGAERDLMLSAAETIAEGPLRERVAEVARGAIDPDSVFAVFLGGSVPWALTGEQRCRVEIMRGVVTLDGAPVRLRGREQELLIALALANGPVSRETLTDRLWPDQDDAVAAGSLRSTLHRLRAQVGRADIVQRDGMRYRLGTTVAVDVHEAEALLSALRRERTDIGAIERQRLEAQFETLARGIPEQYGRWPWFTALETRLVDLRHELGMLLARDDAQHGRFDRAALLTRRLLDLDPLDESAAELHFQALVQAAGRTEATRWLRQYRELLAREYGMEPSFDLDRIAESLSLPNSA